jgi:acetamidase/formamidase
MAEHDMPTDHIHHVWDPTLEPALTIASGDTVHYDIPMAGDGQVQLGDAYPDTSFDFDTIYNLAGPVFVEGAEPGDTLKIEILRLEPGTWGWSAILPEMGLLADDFPEGYVRTFDLTQGDTATVIDGIEVPIVPFFGTMGTAPDIDTPQLPFPPHAGGGNMDTRHLTVGTTLWLPIHQPGALFSVGDPHAAQGDGEVCVTALECPMRSSLRFTLEKRSIPAPSLQGPGAFTPRTDAGGYHLTMGISGDLMEGAQTAVRAMIDWIVDRAPQTSREDAYVLCSLAGDLKILEIVDSGVWNVGFSLPLAVFTGA